MTGLGQDAFERRVEKPTFSIGNFHSPSRLTSAVEPFNTSRVESCRSCLSGMSKGSGQAASREWIVRHAQSIAQRGIVARRAQQVDQLCDGRSVGRDLLHLDGNSPGKGAESGVFIGCCGAVQSESR